MDWYGFKPYVSVAKRRANAKRALARMAKKGHVADPVEIAGRAIATTFWGRAWCDHLESYSDFSNRLPRGRTYVRNGSVVDLKIEPGQITALVSGSELYKIAIRIQPLHTSAWKSLQSQCAGRIGSLVELLQGRLSDDVMRVVTHRDDGLFPKPKQIDMKCSCPDWAGMCKHLAAVLYGVGARLDRQPELLFLLRKVDHLALISSVGDLARKAGPTGRGKRAAIAAENLADVFGIEIDSGAADESGARADLETSRAAPASASRRAAGTQTKRAAAASDSPPKPLPKTRTTTGARGAGRPAEKPKKSKSSFQAATMPASLSQENDNSSSRHRHRASW